MALETPRIYLDYQSTTPTDPRVLEIMLPYFQDRFGNPASSSHRYGWEAREAVELARAQVSHLINAEPEEIVFTSGATESNNLAIKGVAHAYSPGAAQIITVATEHKAVLDPVAALMRQGWGTVVLPVESDGLIDLDLLGSTIAKDSVLVSIMHVNNETGVIQDMARIGKLCHEKQVLFHADGAQSVGKIPVDVAAMNMDLFSLSAHKMYGPQGIGALYVRRKNPRVRLQPQMHGGGHQRGVRAGTLPTGLIAGFGEACRIAHAEMGAEEVRVKKLRDRFLSRILAAVDEITVNGDLEHRLAGNLNITFHGLNGDRLLSALSDLCVSSGSACTTENPESSHVLAAMGLSAAQSRASIRFGFGRFTTAGEIDIATEKVIAAVTRLRAEHYS